MDYGILLQKIAPRVTRYGQENDMLQRPHGKLGTLSEQTDKVDHTWRGRTCLKCLCETKGKQEGSTFVAEMTGTYIRNATEHRHTQSTVTRSSELETPSFLTK
jgi:hypothetical protein